MNKTFEVAIQFADEAENGFSFEVQAKGIRWAIENACKEMKEAYPFFIEGSNYSIVKVELVK